MTWLEEHWCSWLFSFLLTHLFFSFSPPISQRTVGEPTKGWDVFRDPPLKIESGSMANQACLDLSVKILKVFAYLFTFVIVLGGGVISKGCVLFMTAQLRQDRKLPYCNKDLVSDKKKENKIQNKLFYVYTPCSMLGKQKIMILMWCFLSTTGTR